MKQSIALNLSLQLKAVISPLVELLVTTAMLRKTLTWPYTAHSFVKQINGSIRRQICIKLVTDLGQSQAKTQVAWRMDGEEP